MKLFTLILIPAILSFGLTAAAADASSNPDAPLVLVNLKDGRHIQADEKGMTVYLFDQDKDANSTCYDGCAKIWPPILAKDGEVLGASIGMSVRKDGTHQLTYDGFPIYYFAGDKDSGDINGDGLHGVWHIIVE